MKKKNIEGIILSGGALNGILMLGALQYLEDRKILQNIKYFSGTSVGAMISFLIALGYNGTEIITYICQNNLVENLKNDENMTWYNKIKTSSLYNYKIINDELEKLTLQKIGYIPTLLDIYEKIDKTLIFTTYNLTERKIEYLSYKSYPYLDCLTAIRMSCNLPYIFSNFIYQNCEYIDGGIADNFPSKGLSLPFLPKKIKKIGIYINKEKEDISKLSIISRLFLLISIPIRDRETEKINQLSYPIIFINTNNNRLLFEVSNKDKLDMFSLGYNTAKEKI